MARGAQAPELGTRKSKVNSAPRRGGTQAEKLSREEQEPRDKGGVPISGVGAAWLV